MSSCINIYLFCFHVHHLYSYSIQTSLLFVDSIVELFSCILHLIPLVIVPRKSVVDPEAFVAILERYDVTRLAVVPSLLRNLLFFISVSGGGAKRLSRVAMWVCNSETLSPDQAQRFFEIFPNGDKLLANFYGCTETMADVTYETYVCADDVVVQSKENHLSIGQPMFNNVVYIIDDDLNIVRHGKIGEICVSGLNIATGYIDGEMHNKSFISNKFNDVSIERGKEAIYVGDYDVLYRTGDFGRIINGRLIYEGRRDMQVKVSGTTV